MLFLLGDFGTAMEQALSDLDLRPDDADARMLVVGCAIELGDLACARRHLYRLDAGSLPEHLGEQLPFFRYTLARGGTPGGPARAIRHLDGLYLAMGCQPIRLEPAPNRDPFDSLAPVAATEPRCRDGYPPLRDGPLVSVVMTAYNVEHLVKTSVMSILNQNYCNLELIVVDDGSTDGTLEALRLLEEGDGRMQVIAKDANDGTYVSKNLGMLRARGDFMAFQDSDDWSHPDRLGKSIAVLASEPDIVALTTNWVRMTTAGDLILKGTNRYAYKSCISLVFRRKEVMRRSGFFDSVRAGADTEFEIRNAILFGERRVASYAWPLAFGRVRPKSITADAEYGLARWGGKPVREEYRKACRKWHEEIRRGHDGYMPFPLRERPFDAPTQILAASRTEAPDRPIRRQPGWMRPRSSGTPTRRSALG